MSFSAFTSKRGTFGNAHPSSSTHATSEDLSKKICHRRSRSVSAVSRSCTLSNVADFSKKTDNPLFWCTSSSPSPSPPPPALLEPEVIKVEVNASKFVISPTKSEGNCVSDSRRGRSVLRNSECGGDQVLGAGKEIGRRSSSRVDMGRRQRSLSRGRHESSEVWGQSALRNSQCGNQVLGVRKDIGRSLSRVDTGRRQRSLSRGRHESSEVWEQSASRNSECGNQVLGARKDIGRSSSRVDTGRCQRSLSRGPHESSEVWEQSASRNSECGNQVLGARKDIGRSSSRVDTGRCQRSLSRGPHESSKVWGQPASRNSECGNQVLGARKDIGRNSSRVDTGRHQRSLSRGPHERSEVWGQPASRNSECGKQALGARKDIGRSSSRVDTGRRQRSLSRGPHESSEKKINVSASASDQSRGMKTLKTWTSQHPLSEPSDDFTSSLQTTNWEDEISTSSLSEMEEKTIKAVSEQTKSFQGDHPTSDEENGVIYETDRSEVRHTISEIKNDLNNTQELISKLREDLVVEEQREEELGRILEEMLPEPKSVEPQKFRSRRKNSVERWEMSKRLTKEAMNYFDECYISTFDSSDFSSPEDQPVSLSAAPPPIGDYKYLTSTCSSASANFCINEQANLNKESDNQVQSMLSLEPLDLTASSSSKYPIRDQENQDNSRDTAQSRNLQFSFAPEASESVGLHDDIRSYIKKFEKEIRKDGNKDSKGVIRSSYYNAEDYELQVLNERLLFDKVIFKSRIETGGLHLCCGNGVTF